MPELRRVSGQEVNLPIRELHVEGEKLPELVEGWGGRTWRTGLRLSSSATLKATG
jgi:hypothetical protein